MRPPRNILKGPSLIAILPFKRLFLGARQFLGPKERILAHFRGITDHISIRVMSIKLLSGADRIRRSGYFAFKFAIPSRWRRCATSNGIWKYSRQITPIVWHR